MVLNPYFRRMNHTMSSLYRPAKVLAGSGQPTKTKNLSKSQRLMVDLGLIRQSSCPGSFHFLPLGVRSLEKLVRILDHFMEKGNCQKIQMPTLTSTKLWDTTGRSEECSPELMLVSDRHSKRFVLSPTHEEAICDLINSFPLSYRHLPLRMYQITEKFRDEKRPRFGLLRARQFLMKDLYTFDANEIDARNTYEEMIKIYEELFTSLGVKWIKASGTTGTIGGDQSHEFHLPSEVGEDNLLHCHDCNLDFNAELCEVDKEGKVSAVEGSSQTVEAKSSTILSCVKCGSPEISTSKSIEVGHAFLLGTKYSKPLNTVYVSSSNEPELVQMGCYGIGVSRLLAAIVEVLSTEKEIRWPTSIAPYFLSIIPPKAGSKEEKFGADMYDSFRKIVSNVVRNDFIVDDRVDETVGKRLVDAKKLGIPYVAVFGKSLLSEGKPTIELQDINTNKVYSFNVNDASKFLYDAKASIKL